MSKESDTSPVCEACGSAECACSPRQDEQLPPSSADQLKVSINVTELSTILAALRLLQKDIDNLPASIEDIATDDGNVQLLHDGEIDALCERLNCDAHPIGSPGLLEVAKRFCQEVQANGVDYIKRIWPDLYATYEGMQTAIARNESPAQHMREPWTLETLDDYIWLVDANGTYIVELITSDGGGRCGSYQEAYAYAERILECVNGCKGINPSAVADLIEAATEAEFALSDIINAADNQQPYAAKELYQNFSKEAATLHAAIAKTKGHMNAAHSPDTSSG